MLGYGELGHGCWELALYDLWSWVLGAGHWVAVGRGWEGHAGAGGRLPTRFVLERETEQSKLHEATAG